MQKIDFDHTENLIYKLHKIQKFAFDFYQENDKQEQFKINVQVEDFDYQIHSANKAILKIFTIYEDKKYNLKKNINISSLLTFSNKKDIKKVLEKKINYLKKQYISEINYIHSFIQKINEHISILEQFNKGELNHDLIIESILFLKESQYDFYIELKNENKHTVSLPKNIEYKIDNFDLFKKNLIEKKRLSFSDVKDDYVTYHFHLIDIEKIVPIMDKTFVFKLI